MSVQNKHISFVFVERGTKMGHVWVITLCLSRTPLRNLVVLENAGFFITGEVFQEELRYYCTFNNLIPCIFCWWSLSLCTSLFHFVHIKPIYCEQTRNMKYSTSYSFYIIFPPIKIYLTRRLKRDKCEKLFTSNQTVIGSNVMDYYSTVSKGRGMIKLSPQQYNHILYIPFHSRT